MVGTLLRYVQTRPLEIPTRSQNAWICKLRTFASWPICVMCSIDVTCFHPSVHRDQFSYAVVNRLITDFTTVTTNWFMEPVSGTWLSENRFRKKPVRTGLKPVYLNPNPSLLLFFNTEIQYLHKHIPGPGSTMHLKRLHLKKIHTIESEKAK